MGCNLESLFPSSQWTFFQKKSAEVYLFSSPWLKLWADEFFFAAVRSGNLEWSAWPMIFFRLDILINIKETSCNILDRCSVICDSDLQL